MFSSKYSFIFAACPLLMLGCRTHGASDVRGALAGAAAALEAGDAERLFEYIDERTRFALGGAVTARLAARQIIESDYPEAERPAALAALGDAGQVDTGAQLFARRCRAECMRELASQVGAPVSQTAVDNEIRVTTSRGGLLHMFAGQDGRYGIVWNTREAMAERSQASRDLTQIRENAAVYRRRQTLGAR